MMDLRLLFACSYARCHGTQVGRLIASSHCRVDAVPHISIARPHDVDILSILKGLSRTLLCRQNLIPGGVAQQAGPSTEILMTCNPPSTASCRGRLCWHLIESAAGIFSMVMWRRVMYCFCKIEVRKIKRRLLSLQVTSETPSPAMSLFRDATCRNMTFSHSPCAAGRVYLSKAIRARTK